jgi:hypothetical protein
VTNQHGGYRKPANPAPVSGPGKYSRRTDGGPAQSISTVPDQPYGAQTQQKAEQRTAPMAGTAPLPTPAPVSQPSPEASLPPYQGGAFNAPSARPGEPVTAGAPMGPGPGPEVLSAPVAAPAGQGDGSMTQLLTRYAATDTTGVLAKLLMAAQNKNA